MEEARKEENKAVKYEVCVLCREETRVPVDLHINWRPYYIEGCGQLCESCGKDVGN